MASLNVSVEVRGTVTIVRVLPSIHVLATANAMLMGRVLVLTKRILIFILLAVRVRHVKRIGMVKVAICVVKQMQHMFQEPKMD
jgi:hypothetical protein